MRTPFLAALALLSLAACTPRELTPAKAPSRIVPDVPSVPAEPAEAKHGRVLLESEEVPAVVSLATPPAPFGPGRVWAAEEEPAAQADGTGSADTQPKALLCVTPCAVDLPVGAHRLVFTAVDDASRSSVATVGVSDGTTAVRHVMDESKPMRAGWVLGFMGAFVGSPITIGGATALAFASSGSVEPARDARALQVASGVTLAIGGAMLVGGILAMEANRGSHRKGATTTFPVAARSF